MNRYRTRATVFQLHISADNISALFRWAEKWDQNDFARQVSAVALRTALFASRRASFGFRISSVPYPGFGCRRGALDQYLQGSSQAARICGNADFQFAVSPNGIRQSVPPAPCYRFFARSADYKSAIQQSSTLRYFVRGFGALGTDAPYQVGLAPVLPSEQ